MTNLMAEHSRKLIEAVRTFDQPAIEVDEATRKSEGVDLRRVDDAKLPGEVRPRRPARNAAAQLSHVRVDVGVTYQRQLGLHLLGVLSTERNLLIFRDLARR